MQACIIVPCFNEEKRIVSDSFIDFSHDYKNISFIFVNDGSSDNTPEVLKKICIETPKNSFIDLTQNLGKSGAVREGMLKAYKSGFTHIGYLDADLTIPLETARKLIQSLDDKKVDFVFASRTNRFKRQKGQNFFRQTVGYLFSLLSRTILQLPVQDTQCGAKFFRATTVPVLFEARFMSKWIFDVEIFFRFKEHFHENTHKNFWEYPLDHWEDNHDSKVKFMDYVKVPFTLMSIFFYYRS
ncbi:MAG: glycosyltransferase [Bacteriovorax sp.]|nr:glycosyltransferase [Bacteriovorax sp.]